MEHDLGRTEDIQSSIGVNRTVSTERLHHRLLARFRVIRVLHNDITVLQNRIDISVAALTGGTEISFVVCAYRTQGFPGFLRMNQNLIVLRFPEIQQRFQHLIFHLQDFQRLVHSFFTVTCHDCNRIAHISHMTVQDQAVIGTRLRIRLSRHRKTLLRYIFPGINCFNPGYFFCRCLLHALHDRVGMRAAQNLDDQAVLIDQIVHIDWLSCHQRHRVFFSHRLADCSHCFASFFHSRKFRIPLSCPSYPEQRQRFPARYSLISSSFGSGFSRNNARAFIINPGLQNPHCSAP